MAAINKRALSVGISLGLSFFGVLFLIFSPIFGDGKNGLQFADDMFNKLSKGSSYFIPKVMEANKKFIGKEISVTITMEKPDQVEKAVKVLTVAGASVEVKDREIKIVADLGSLLEKALRDSDDMYKNDGKKVSERYGFDEKEVMVSWWNVMKVLDKQLKKEGKINESRIVSDVMKKAVETAHNFYGIEAVKVTEKAVLMAGLLIFYVLYTMWWGFAIYYLFEGIGLSMTKAKH
ncbi:MAG: hypothetical protein N2257_03390 [Thermodesulfovibrionales bacterium]|nr:hypothetical protein [Thermodesulfovibrionales bacterium]